MEDISDEILMQFADGALSQSEMARIKAIVSVRPDLKARVAAFAATGATLASHFDQPMREPAPRRLVDAVLRVPIAATGTQSHARNPNFLERVWRGLLSRDAWQWSRNSSALAASIMLLIGVGGGWLLHDVLLRGAAGKSPLIVFEAGQAIAVGSLAHVLETSPSGIPIQLDRVGSMGSGTARVHLTFNSTVGYCRQYEVTADGGNAAGIGCRDVLGRWHVRIHTILQRATSSKEAIRPAGSNEIAVLNATIAQLIVGDALSPDEESEWIMKHWQR